MTNKQIETLVNSWSQTYEKLLRCECALNKCVDVIENCDIENEMKVPGDAQEYQDEIDNWPMDFEKYLEDLFPEFIFKKSGDEYFIVQELN